jgi:hypothetical protein
VAREELVAEGVVGEGFAQRLGLPRGSDGDGARDTNITASVAAAAAAAPPAAAAATAAAAVAQPRVAVCVQAQPRVGRRRLLLLLQAAPVRSGACCI